MDFISEKLKSVIVKNKEIIFLFFLGLFLRLLGLINIRHAGDNIVFWFQAAKIVSTGVLPLLGPTASVNPNFHLGPFYYYFLAIPYFLSGGDFRGSIIFSCVLNSLSIIILYLFCLKYFTKRQSLQISALYSFSSYIISVQNFPWNPYTLPLFTILSLYIITKVKEGKFILLPILFALFSASIQLHATAIFLLPMVLYLLPLKKIPAKFYTFSFFSFIIILSPWIYFNLLSNFSQIKEAILIFSPHINQSCNFFYWLANHGHGEYCFWFFRNTLFMFRMFSVSIFSSTNIVLVLVTLLIVPIFLLRAQKKYKNWFLIWLLFPFLVFLLYSSNIYLHYFLILTPLPFFIFIIILNKIENKFSKGKLISNLILFTVILLNIINYIYSLGFSRG